MRIDKANEPNFRIHSEVVSVYLFFSKEPSRPAQEQEDFALNATSKTVMTLANVRPKRLLGTYATNEASLASISLLAFSECR